jgi:superfamily II DNA or RNA helicase
VTLAKLPLETEYRSAQSELATTFYRWCLDEASTYDRAAGYFSSTVFIVVGARMVEFAKRGGRMRLVCSPQLSAADIEALNKGHADLDKVITERLLEELDALVVGQSEQYPLKALATLVAVGTLQIQIAVRAQGHGIFHEKLGVFEDQAGNAVSFIGSANETWKGWHPEGNYEAIEVFCSWTPDASRVAKHRAHFARVWERRDPSLSVVAFPDAVRQRLCERAAANLDDLKAPSQTQASQRPRPSPRAHQLAAIEAWKANGYKGIFKHATGSGKTLTACFAMEPHLKSGGVVLVLVPSQLLLSQWQTELKAYFTSPDILLIGAGNTEWRQPGTLRSFSSSDRFLGGRIILGTMQTARSEEFIGRLKQGAHLLLIADEVHQIGSRENSNAMAIDATQRLGLSATPERYNDPLGTLAIKDYFGDILPPEYTLADAIADNHLVPYEYHPMVVHLSETEADEWRAISKEISALVAREHANSASTISSTLLERLILKRARIAKKAESKPLRCQTILRDNYARGQSWLVYCEDQAQLNEIVAQTRTWCGDVLEYHSSMQGDARATLSWFQERGGILVAIACLDEGVNIPSISHAIILASSQNPRQFIQRRGRILRRFPGKRIAYVYDVLVSPEDVDAEPTQRSLLKSELRRALEFASSATNQSATSALRLIAVRAGLDPDSVDDAGIEEDNSLENIHVE